MSNNIDHFLSAYHDYNSILDPYDIQFLGALYGHPSVPSELRADINQAILDHDDATTINLRSGQDDGSEIQPNEDINASRTED